MNYNMLEYDKAIGICTYTVSQLNKICSLYIKKYRKLNNITLREKKDSPVFCTNLFYIGGPAWFIELEQRVADNKCEVTRTIIISDKNGQVFESCCNACNIQGNTILTKKDVLKITDEHIKYLHSCERKKLTYTVLADRITYEVCNKNSEGDYEPVWVVPVECEEEKWFSDPCHYLEISDLTGEIIHIMNCHGRYIESEIYGDKNNKSGRRL
ncbi:MAG: hypothetical protein Q4F95_08760 [Oscillospiraceae bacterium]|nr:hypothetical protein [Oscillospiraceae bacterium]